MTNDNEKDLFQESAVESELTDVASENTDDMENIPEETTDNEDAQCCTGCCDCCHADCGAEQETYAYVQPEAPKRKIMTPIIIAAIALVAVAAVVFGSIFVYNTFFKTGPQGVWEMSGAEGSGVYFEFDAPDKDGKGNVYMKGGSITYFGTYELVTCNVDKDTELPDVVTSYSAVEPLSGEVKVLKSDFYMFGVNGGEFIFTTEAVDGVDTMTLSCLDYTGAAAEISFVKSELPEFKLEPSKMSNASADEAGVAPMQIDKNIIGTWSEADYGTYTFYEDGTANYSQDYQINQMYALYGMTMGYGMNLDFNYTVGDGNIYMGIDYYTGESADDVMVYYLDGNNLVINGVGYTKVE